MKLVCCFSVIIACSCIKKKENKKGGEGDVIYEDPEKNMIILKCSLLLLIRLCLQCVVLKVTVIILK